MDSSVVTGMDAVKIAGTFLDSTATKAQRRISCKTKAQLFNVLDRTELLSAGPRIFRLQTCRITTVAASEFRKNLSGDPSTNESSKL